MRIKYSLFVSLWVLFICFTSCSKEDEASPFGTSCIKRSISPNLVGQKIEFAFAMAVKPEMGKLKNVEINASIPGAAATYIDPNSYSTNNTGIDVGVPVASPSALQGNICSANIIAETNAATLRFYYVVPEEARGKEVSFTFTAFDSNNAKSSCEMGPFQVSKMNMTKNLLLKNGAASYLSIRNMAVYTDDQITADPQLASKIDLVYVFNSNTAIKHALYSPSAPAEAHPGVTFPSGVNAASNLVRTWALRDQQLSDLQWGIFVDDIDLKKQSFDGATSFLLDLKNEAGTWIETADKTQRAYVFINKIDDSKQEMTVSIKRLTDVF